MSARLRWLASVPLVVAVIAMVGTIWIALGRPAAAGMPAFSGFHILELLVFASFAAVGALVSSRRPSHPIGWLLAWLGATIILARGMEEYALRAVVLSPGSLPFPTLADWVAEWAWAPTLAAFPFTLLLFPDGRLPSRRWRWYAGTLVVAGVGISVLAPAVTWGYRGQLQELETMPLETLVVALAGFLLLGILAGAASVILRFRRAAGQEKLQLKWLAYASSLVLVTLSGNLLLSPVLGGSATNATFGQALLDSLPVFGFLTVPVAIAIALLRYRLYDIDVVISKTVVFAGLAGFITAIYVGIVVGVGTLLGAGGEPNLALSIVATAVVAVAFQPVRERLTRVANRLVFGRRATPYEVLSTFSSHLAEVAAPEQTLERMARLLVDGTGAARAQVWLRVAGELRPAATWPSHATDGAAPEHLVDVVHEGEALGALSLDKQRGESLTPADVKLVDDLAAQAGLVLRNLRLTDDLRARIVDLQASRQRLVAAQDAERRRLERDLHDGAQRQLLELKSQLAAASSTAATEHAGKAAQILEQVAADADDAAATLRELAHGIYPPLLAAEGLAGALTAQAAKAAVPVVVEGEGVGRYPQDVEAAVYFCVLEAVQNAAKYANPTQVTVRLAEHDGQLTFEVVDDGAGFDPTTTVKGAGTTNMTDRLDALGGSLGIESRPGIGTTITGALPATIIGANA